VSIPAVTGECWAPRLGRAWRAVSAHLAVTPLVASPALADGLLLKLETRVQGVIRSRGVPLPVKFPGL
jgi:hypothetical protein